MDEMAISTDSTTAMPLQVLMNNTTSYESVKHPYYPLDANIVGYVTNDSTVFSLLGSFIAGCAAIFGLTILAAKRINPRLPASELITVLWFVLCGCIHLFFEGKKVVLGENSRVEAELSKGYFAYNHADMGGLQTFFGQLWKEYALSDSRYLTGNIFVFCVEAMTAVSDISPTSLTTKAYLNATDSLGPTQLCSCCNDRDRESAEASTASSSEPWAVLW